MADSVDLNNMTGVNFMKTAVEWLNKKIVENNLIPGYITGYTTVDRQTKERIQHDFHTTFRFEGEDLVIDSSNAEFHNFGWNFGWKSPAVTILVDLALEMGWFKGKESPDGPKYGLKLGPNLVME